MSDISPPGYDLGFSWTTEMSAFGRLHCWVGVRHCVCQPCAPLRQHRALLREPSADPMLAMLFLQQPKADLQRESTPWEMHPWKTGAGAAEPR